MRRRQLTPRQERFVAEYVSGGGNATQAAIRAGYETAIREDDRMADAAK